MAPSTRVFTTSMPHKGGRRISCVNFGQKRDQVQGLRVCVERARCQAGMRAACKSSERACKSREACVHLLVR
eukprot:7229148-Prymnesium_polylepis.1